jgi:predicted nucleic acid-binding protein
MNLVDTSGWIAYFFGEENAALFAEPIEDTENLIVPVICLYEVFKKVLSVAGESMALRAVAQMKQGRVVDVSEEIALKAALLSNRHKLPMADSLIYATGQIEHALIWTQDSDFEHLDGVRYVKAPA